MTSKSNARKAPPYERLGSARRGYSADWSDARHHYRRFASEFIGTYGFVFSLTVGAAVIHAYARPPLSNEVTTTLLSLVAATWLVIAIYALGDLSAHFNPAVTFAFALRGDLSWRRAALYWAVQCAAAAAAALTARMFFGTSSGLAAVAPQPGLELAAVVFEMLITGAFVLLLLAMTAGPKLNGPFTPLAVGAFVMSCGTMAGLYEGTAYNPARAFGPDLALGRFDTLWIYVLGDFAGAALAVLVDSYLRGAANPAEAAIAESEQT